MFKGFDYGKGLSKQLEAYRRLPAQQRQRREARLGKQYDSYCKKFLDALNNSSSTNPGLLKNAAEIIVDTAKELGSSGNAFSIFAEMVSRSRKVPVIPGLSGLVDNMLEQDTELRAERLALLNWRITTGNMRVDRYLSYQVERARLSGDSEHWKDLCWGLLQLVQKGTIKPQDGPALEALEILQKKHHELGEKIVDVLMMLAEARYAQSNFAEMERCLLEVGTRSTKQPSGFFELLEMLLNERPDACWELHQLALNHALQAVVEGRQVWSTAEAAIARSRKYRERRLDYLLEHPLMVKLEPLAHFVLDAILNLPENKVHQTLLRWRYAFSSRGADMTDSVKKAYTAAKEQGYTGMDSIPTVVQPADMGSSEMPGAEETQVPSEDVMPEPPQVAQPGAVDDDDVVHVPLEVSAAVDQGFAEEFVPEDEPESEVQPQVTDEEEAAAEVQMEEPASSDPEPAPEPQSEPEAVPLDEEAEHEPTLYEQVLACSNAKQLQRVLTAAYPLADEDITSIEQILDDSNATRQPWLPYEIRLELAKWHAVNRDSASAEEALKPIEVPLNTTPKSLISRIHGIFGDAMPDIALKVIAETLLTAGDFLQSIDYGKRIGNPEARQGTLNEIQNWLLVQSDPSPLMEIAAAEIQRVLSGDDTAELETAIRASLLAPDYEPVQQLYAGWLEATPAAEVNLARAKVAASLCNEGPSAGMAREAAKAIMALLEEPGGSAAAATARELVIDLRGALEEYGLLDDLAGILEDEFAAEPLTADSASVETEEQPAEEAAAVETSDEPTAEVAELQPNFFVSANGQAEEEQPEEAEETEDVELTAEAGEEEVAAEAEESTLEVAAFLAEADQADTEEAAQEPELELAHASVGATAASVGATHGGVNWGAVTNSEIAGHLSSGDWHGAGKKAGEVYGSGNGDSVGGLTGIYHSLPSEAMLPFSEGLAQSYTELEEYGKLIDVLSLINVELSNGKRSLREDTQLQSFIDGTLHSLCEKAFTDSFDDEYEFTAKTESGRQAINDLLILARSGDKTACLQLHKAFVAILKNEPDAPLLQVIADVLAPMLKESAPQQSLKLVARAGLAVNDARWALSRIDDLELACTEAESCFLLGQLYLAKDDLQMSCSAIEKLISMGDSASARELLTQLSEPSVGKLDSMVQLTRMFVLLDPPDYDNAFDQLLEIYQMVSESSIDLKPALAPLAALSDERATQKSNDLQVCKFQLLLYAVLGESGKVLSITEQLFSADPVVGEKLLRTIDRIAMQDNAIPPLAVIGWAKALLITGRTGDALDKLAGIADSGVEYQAYTRLLEEAKQGCESADAHMQLAETYLRNHLWMRSADEYRHALAKDSELCEPIFTQLKRWGALELDPIKHPVHLLAVQATAMSNNPENWSWALEALPWLRESWPPKDLHQLALDLWENRGRTELDDNLTSVLIEQLIELAIDSNSIESATSLLVEVWEPGSKLAHAMRPVIGSIEKRLRTGSTTLLFQFKKIMLQDAIAELDVERLGQAADDLAEAGEQGRQAVISLLCSDELPENLAGTAGCKALEYLRLEEPRDQKEFLKLLNRLGNRELPISATRTLIHSAVSLMNQESSSPELQSSVFALLRNARDDQRSAALAAYLAQPGQQLAADAAESIAELAIRNHSPQQCLTMAELCLLGGSEARQAYEWLAKAGAKLDLDYTVPLTALAHSLAGTAAAAEGHAGLSLFYRKAGDPDRAAQELLWAHQAGSKVDMGWLANADSGNLGFYSALLLLDQHKQEEAVARLQHVVVDGAADVDHSVAARMTMAQLALEQDRITEAFSQAEAAKAMSPKHPLANEMIDSLKQEIFRERLEAAKDQVESAERTLMIAQLHKENGAVTDAINELQAGIRKGFANEDVFLELAECFSLAGQHNISRRAYFEALKRLEQRNGDSELMVRALYGLAQEDIQLGNQDEAISNLEYLQLIKSDYRDAQLLIEQLYKAKDASSKPNSPDVASQVLEQIMTLLGKDGQNTGIGGEA